VRGALLLLLATLAACARGDEPTILAAASLGDVVPEIFAGSDARLSLAPTSALARQVEQGIDADLLLSADRAWIDALREKGFGREAREFARNALAAWVRQGEPAPRAPADLADPRWGRVAVGEAAVPVGRYAREALAGMDVALLPCRSAPAVVAALRAGEARVGIAYATDAGPGDGLEIAFRFAKPSVSYWALRLRDRPEARVLWARLFTPEAAAALERHGFLPVR